MFLAITMLITASVTLLFSAVHLYCVSSLQGLLAILFYLLSTLALDEVSAIIELIVIQSCHLLGTGEFENPIHCSTHKRRFTIKEQSLQSHSLHPVYYVCSFLLKTTAYNYSTTSSTCNNVNFFSETSE